MDFNGQKHFQDISKVPDIQRESYLNSDVEAQEKYDKLLHDDEIDNNKLSDIHTTNELDSDKDWLKEYDELLGDDVIEDNIYETDDDGKIYKINGVLQPDMKYKVNGNIYKTDENGRIVSCEFKPSFTEDGPRDNVMQKEVGGEDRKEDDDGGHIVARILGGTEGDENLVPMRRGINRGDYKRMENELADAVKDGMEATVHTELKYEGESERPSKIKTEYSIDNKTTIVEFDNEDNSVELLKSINKNISKQDYKDLKEEIKDMKDDGIDATITSVKVEYDEKDQPIKITVGMLDESTGIKTYKVYEPREQKS